MNVHVRDPLTWTGSKLRERLAGTDRRRAASGSGHDQGADNEGRNHEKILAVGSGVANYEDRPVRAGGLYLSLVSPLLRPVLP